MSYLSSWAEEKSFARSRNQIFDVFRGYGIVLASIAYIPCATGNVGNPDLPHHRYGRIDDMTELPPPHPMLDVKTCLLLSWRTKLTGSCNVTYRTEDI